MNKLISNLISLAVFNLAIIAFLMVVVVLRAGVNPVRPYVKGRGAKEAVLMMPSETVVPVYNKDGIMIGSEFI